MEQISQTWLPSNGRTSKTILTPVKRGEIAVAYQGRKKAKTTNMLFLTDQQGIPLACSEPVAGNHNDLFEIEKTVSKIIRTLKDAVIAIEGLFMYADAGFDSKKLRALCDMSTRFAIDPFFGPKLGILDVRIGIFSRGGKPPECYLTAVRQVNIPGGQMSGIPGSDKSGEEPDKIRFGGKMDRITHPVTTTLEKA